MAVSVIEAPVIVMGLAVFPLPQLEKVYCAYPLARTSYVCPGVSEKVVGVYPALMTLPPCSSATYMPLRAPPEITCELIVRVACVDADAGWMNNVFGTNAIRKNDAMIMIIFPFWAHFTVVGAQHNIV